jgi:CubicO group peptidase (beta-lactamase class C family)
MKKRNTALVFITSWTLLISGIYAQELNRKIDEVMNAFVKLDQFSGTVLVAKDGKPLYAKAFGEADKDHHVKNTLDTKFNIGSIGKTFTGTAIMQLAERGKLKVTDPASKYLDGFPFGDKITIHHLLSHTSGTFNYFAHPEFQNKMFTIRSVNDALPLIYDQNLRFETPGEQFLYSNSGIVILGAIIEKITGQRYSSYIRENILQPLGMNDTGINYLEQIIENRASGYVKSPTSTFSRNIFAVPPANADGGIETTVGDMLKFDQALYGDKLVGEIYKQKMFTPNLNNYGYCWRISEKFGNIIISHSGGAPGVSANFQRYITDKYTIIVLSNYDVDRGNVARTIEAILFGAEYEMPRPTCEEFLYKIMNEQGTDFLLKNYRSLLNENKYPISNSAPLNLFGYGLLQEHALDNAIAIFELNIKLFPDEANSYDSLGDGYLQKGDKESAIKAFKKALEIDPDFSSSKEKLEILMKNP